MAEDKDDPKDPIGTGLELRGPAAGSDDTRSDLELDRGKAFSEETTKAREQHSGSDAESRSDSETED